MKVFVYGNTLNIALKLTLILREKGIDAEMFLDNTSPLRQDYPEWEYPEMQPDKYPSWIHYYPFFPNLILPGKKTRKLIQDFGQCDVALVSGWGPILAMKANVPAVFISAGSDLNNIAIRDELRSVFMGQMTLKDRVKRFIKASTFSVLQLKALKKHVSTIVVYMGYQINRYIVKNNLMSKTVLATFPRDVINYPGKPDAELEEKYKGYKVVFFMISRHSWQSVWNDAKGNDKFIRAYARFVKKHNPNALLIMARKGIDVEASAKLVEKEQIQDHVEWVENLPIYKLKAYQQLKNAVMVDNFWHNDWKARFPEDTPEPRVGFGFGCIESLASKRPLITAFTDKIFYDNTTPPILYAFTEDEILNRIEEAYSMEPAALEKMGADGYDFVLKWHEQTKVIDKHIALLEEAYKKSTA